LEELTPKRKKILDFIVNFSAEKGYAPSVREIVRACGISSASIAQYHLNVLERQGYIRRERDTPRSISLSDRRAIGADVPLLGTIAAGEPIPVPSSDTWTAVPEERIEVPNELLRGRQNVYALRVKGMSMIDALVDDGDVVILEQASGVEDGQMVAAWLTDREETTLKRLYREPGRIRLQPANRAMAPLYVAPDDVEVQGRVIAVLRRLE